MRARAARSLHNIVHAHPADKHCKREAKVLKLLEVLRQYSDFLRDVLEAVRIILYFDIFVPLFQQVLSKIVHFVCNNNFHFYDYRELAVVLVKLL